MTRSGLGACCLLLLAACATSQPVTQPGASGEHAISCSYFGWYLCYERAKELCPDGYRVLSQSEGYRPKEMRVACSPGQRNDRTHSRPATDLASVMRPSRTMATASSKGTLKTSRNSPWSRLRFCSESCFATNSSIASSV